MSDHLSAEVMTIHIKTLHLALLTKKDNGSCHYLVGYVDLSAALKILERRAVSSYNY